MISAESLVYYPAYCFHLSPTIDKWCPLRATDIHGLERRPEFQADNVLFYLNHPIRWVRIVGVVVAIDDYYSNRVYTVDDSSGECIECSTSLPKPDPGLTKTSADGETANATASIPGAHSDIDVGMVVDVKGSTNLYRDQKQIKIHKMQRIRSTEYEVQFWKKIRDFRKDVISRPWILENREVRRCKKEYMADADVEADKKERMKRNISASGKYAQTAYNGTTATDTRRKLAKEVLSIRRESKNAYTKGEYDALGL
ncbi:uncharacterized protein GGS25DRAFT_487464 [Hypoxylon fragiforme]|uniref:uncharacterized protein n=1 Tax=Hypoxylon fragiforme TaxID=63214 RepID=UPI0020C5F083|nr:uncharacterized protein GGS25DRAFT_487464 [Hypoxylon fragiforme]KAI2610105.1 hypothetical protein GGS25DRAFT_487464 [Hypoxylon fragiforme]